MSKEFVFPLHVLENDRVRLVPFEPEQHLQLMHDVFYPHPSLFDYIPMGPFANVSEFEQFYMDRVHHDKGICLYVVYARPNPSVEWEIAGLIGYLNSSKEHLKTEIGFVIILPKWQRTFVTGNATGLLLFNALELPENGGLGLRRVQWQASYVNQASLRAAKRLGFRFEGVLRWDRCLARVLGQAPMLSAREGDPRAELEGRHTAMFSIGWDAWEGVRLEGDPLPWWESEDGLDQPSVKEKVRAIMARTS